MVTPATMRRPCFIGEDDGLASIAEFSGNNNTTNINNNNNINFNNNNGYFVNQTHQNNNMPYMMRRRNSLRNITSLSTSTSSRAPPSAVSVSYSTSATVVSSPRSARLFDPRFEEVHSPHFLEACALCRKPLGGNRDIFMYRGDTPFCSEECRQEQIEIDEAKEKNWNLKALRNKKEAKKSASTTSSSSSKAQTYPFRTGTIAAA